MSIHRYTLCIDTEVMKRIMASFIRYTQTYTFKILIYVTHANFANFPNCYGRQTWQVVRFP